MEDTQEWYPSGPIGVSNLGVPNKGAELGGDQMKDQTSAASVVCPFFISS